ncbi:MAG TPA: polymorphic toxin type 44 domain-containing protein [Bryobacteraceae bacterium]|nr:polymorphic toxin type 44 domain-containing protein [Bryobacteraceae bacterium]
MAKINPNCIRTPASPVPKSFVPAASTRYKVQTGDSWVSLATRSGMDPWALIRFNYPNLPASESLAAREVNWYLQEYVGCKTLTADNLNYIFTSADAPGYVFLPAPKAAPAPVTPVPAPPKAIQLNFWRSRIIIPWMQREMVKNAQSSDVSDIRNLNSVGVGDALLGVPWIAAQKARALQKWKNLVKGGAVWDHKKPIRDMLGLKKGDFHFPIEGDNDHEYFYDIWSNIHYGYVGTAAGFSRWELQKGAAMGGAAGANDDIDVETVDIGIELWKRHGPNLTAEQLRTGVLAHTNRMLQIQGTADYINIQKGGADPDFKHITGIVDGQ